MAWFCSMWEQFIAKVNRVFPPSPTQCWLATTKTPPRLLNNIRHDDDVNICAWKMAMQIAKNKPQKAQTEFFKDFHESSDGSHLIRLRFQAPSSFQGRIIPLKSGSRPLPAKIILRTYCTKYYELFQAPRFDPFLSGMIQPWNEDGAPYEIINENVWESIRISPWRMLFIKKNHEKTLGWLP